MPLLVLIALLAFPFLEFGAMYLVAAEIGVGWTLVALFAASAAGVVVIRLAGLRGYRDVDEALRTGEVPQRGMLDTLMVLVGGFLLAIPGFLTGVLGLVLALPLTRPVLRWAFEKWARRRMERFNATVVNATVVDAEAARAQRPDPNPGPTVIRGTVLPEGDTTRGPESGPTSAGGTAFGPATP
ncbi:FxsA family protein [Spiractinospora alimapuensis]|uniref:FxsA family protein n=1 Tax=Spiractinospora alimapuensis TaxID=2820884 RepID=UPI001F23910E|nr:FxsA family protein [Spiractinospora alimapuensis]QVQ52531.1 FxsA family protein [Spiractinospora alimapuensis]